MPVVALRARVHAYPSYIDWSKGPLQTPGLVAGRYQPLADDDASNTVASPDHARFLQSVQKAKTRGLG